MHHIYRERLYNHEIAQAMQFAETRFWHSCINGNLQNFIKILTVTAGF